jgi:hypothetical protein
MDTPIPSQADLAHLMAVAEALQLDTAVLAAGRSLTEIAEILRSVIDYRTLNGGW